MTPPGHLPPTPASRLAAFWVYGGAASGVLLLALGPLLVGDWPWPAILAYSALPAYMLHQWEEHDDDRFRRFVNDRLAGGRTALSLADVAWINLVGVWGGLAAALWLLRASDPGWGLLAAYLLLVNGAAHGIQAVALRGPNPGLWSGLVVFLPLGLAILLLTSPRASLVQHLLSLALVLAVHAGIMVRVRLALRVPA